MEQQPHDFAEASPQAFQGRDQGTGEPSPHARPTKGQGQASEAARRQLQAQDR